MFKGGYTYVSIKCIDDVIFYKGANGYICKYNNTPPQRCLCTKKKSPQNTVQSMVMTRLSTQPIRPPPQNATVKNFQERLAIKNKSLP